MIIARIYCIFSDLIPIQSIYNCLFFSDVSILFQGEGSVKWTESNPNTNYSGGTQTHHTIYASYETYVNNFTLVYGDGILPIGRHIFTFNIPLPLECPSSLEGEYGHIRYEIILKINRYYTFDNVFKKSVNIIKRVDLNFNPGYKVTKLMPYFTKIIIYNTINFYSSFF